MSQASQERPPELVAGIPVDWGPFSDYCTVLTPPRLETGDSYEYRAVVFLVEVKQMVPAKKHFMARFYDTEGLLVKWSVVHFEPSLDTEVPGRCAVLIWWAPEMASVDKIMISLE